MRTIGAVPRPRVAQIDTVPAPTKGLNDLDSIANMDPEYAIDLLNWFPGQSSLKVRPGYSEWHTGHGVNNIETIMCYNPADVSNEKMFVASDLGIFDNSTSGDGPWVPIVGATNGHMSYVNYSNVAGNYLVVVNGTDPGWLYNGSSWTVFTTVSTPTNPGQVSGASMSNMSVIHTFKKRLWFAQKNTLTAWYLPTDSVGGAMKPFYLGGEFTKGGYLINIYTWSVDSGAGMDDILIFMSSKGEIALYQGNDPDAVGGLKIVGVYYVGSPLNDRTMADLGGEVLMLTTNGLIPISMIVGGQQALSTSQGVLSRNINRSLARLIRERNNDPRWELLVFPPGQMLLINFPDLNGAGAIQYVMNTITGAWCRFDLPILTLDMCMEVLYFSDQAGRVLVMTGNMSVDDVPLTASVTGRSFRLGQIPRVDAVSEGDPTLGKPIVTEVRQAYNYFGKRGVNKHFNMLRPLFVSPYRPGFSIRLSLDFSPSGIYDDPNPPLAPPTVDLWDEAIWDEAFFSPEVQTYYEWVGTEGLGYCASLVMRATTNVPTEFVSVDWSYEGATSI